MCCDIFLFFLNVLLGLCDESKDGPYYTQLGAASSINGVQKLMQSR